MISGSQRFCKTPHAPFHLVLLSGEELDIVALEHKDGRIFHIFYILLSIHDTVILFLITLAGGGEACFGTDAGSSVCTVVSHSPRTSGLRKCCLICLVSSLVESIIDLFHNKSS
jgi:hypothetical protein